MNLLLIQSKVNGSCSPCDVREMSAGTHAFFAFRGSDDFPDVKKFPNGKPVV
jgi:hypothetical protein